MKTLKIKNRINKVILILTVLTAVTGLQCNREKLLYKSWILEQYGPEDQLVSITFPSQGDLPVKKQIVLNLAEDGKFSGNDGCNSIFGSFKSGRCHKIEFMNISSTLMMCRQEVMSQAGAIRGILRNVKKYKVNETSLLLLTDNREVLKYMAKQ